MSIAEIATIGATIILFVANVLFTIIGFLVVRLLSKSKDEISHLNNSIDHLYQSVNTLNINVATVVANLTNTRNEMDKIDKRVAKLENNKN